MWAMFLAHVLVSGTQMTEERSQNIALCMRIEGGSKEKQAHLPSPDVPHAAISMCIGHGVPSCVQRSND